jgi:aryl-alcohol dehydrogenase-like predicted oxidoreductase
VIPWSPLARGLLTGKRVKGGEETERARTDNFAKQLYTREDDFSVASRVGEVAKERGVPEAQIALAWMLSKPVITAPIIGATKPGHLEDAVAALVVKLSEDEIRRLEEIYRPHPVLGYS